MANDVPASEPAVDVGHLMSGQQLDESVKALLEASNWAMANIGSGTPRISQVFPLRGSSAPGSTYVTVSPGGGAQLVCEWPMPTARGATAVDCYLYAKSSSGAAEWEMRSVVDGSVTGADTITSSWSLLGPLSLGIKASGGYEKVRLFIDDNGDTVHLGAVLVTIPPEASPLAAGADGMGCVAFDAGECDADEPLAADHGATLIANADAMRDQPHVYLSWSSLVNTALGSDANRMVAWPHVATCHRWVDTDRKEWDLTIVARVGPTSGGTLVVHAVTSAGLPGIVSTTIAVASSLSEQYVTGSIRLPAANVVRAFTAGWQTCAVMVWPEPTATGAVSRLRGIEGADDGLTDVAIRGLSIYGR